MKKKIALGIVGALVLGLVGVFGAAAMQPDTFEVERSRVIPAAPDAILPHLTNLQNWAVWNPWADIDPNQTTTFSDPPEGVDAWYAWEGNDDVGKGKMTITSASDTEVAYHLEFIEPYQSESEVTISLTPDGTGTRVTWGMTGDNNFMGKVFSLFMDFEEMLQSDFDRGLERLEGAVAS